MTELAPIKKFGMTVNIKMEDWKCDYCDNPLGESAVTTPLGFAHRGCSPIFAMIDADLRRAITAVNGDDSLGGF